MHDWVLNNILINWIDGNIEIHLKNNSSEGYILFCKDFSNIKIPRQNDWGESISINETSKIHTQINGNSSMIIEMQSGDKIILEAKEFRLSKME